MANPKLVEAGRFSLTRKNEQLLWEGQPDGEIVHLEELSFRPDHWPVGTVIIAYEPEQLPESEQKRVFGGSVKVEGT